MRHFSGEFEGVRLLMADELDLIAGGEGDDTDDVDPVPDIVVTAPLTHAQVQAYNTAAAQAAQITYYGTVILGAAVPETFWAKAAGAAVGLSVGDHLQQIEDFWFDWFRYNNPADYPNWGL